MVYKLNPTLRKILYVLLWYVIYPQLVYLWLIPEVFSNQEYVLMFYALIISYIVGVLDTYFRPFSDSISDDWASGVIYNLILVGLFLFHPFLVAVAFKEYQNFILTSFPIWGSTLVSMLGILFIILGGVVTVTGRAQLSRFGSGIIHIEEDHKLITTEIYGFIRHPIYAGGLLGIIGIYMSFHSLLTLTGVTVIYFLVMRHRINYEEEVLIEEFGDQYRDYMKKTKRMIPYIY